MKKILFICLFICLFLSHKALADVECDAVETPKVSLVFHGRLKSFSVIEAETVDIFEQKNSQYTRYFPHPQRKYKLYKVIFEVLKVIKGDYKEKMINIYSLENLDSEKNFYGYAGEELIVEATTFQDWYRPARIKGMRKDLLEKYDIKLMGDLENSHWIPDDGCNSRGNPRKLQRINVQK